MDRLWSPWRYHYISQQEPSTGCIFCLKPGEGRDAENFIVHRGTHCFVLLNLYPYTNGHMMIAPYLHVASLADCGIETLTDLMLLTRRAEQALRAVYQPDGLNIGMNLGVSAGAGIADHIHMHALPRWMGDSNFMTTVGETRVLPEELTVTYEKLRSAFRELAGTSP